jgi:hypothetical protein
MDTQTVLEIIKKLDSHIKVIAEEYKDVDTDPDQNVPMDPSYWITVGKEMALTDLRDHLQSYIEGQLNAAENSTPE